MDSSIIAAQLGHTVDAFSWSVPAEHYAGKVRDTYRLEDQLILITTDRISAFDHILKQTIPFKGQVLNQLAAYFFAQTEDIIPNHLIAVPDPNVTIGQACDPVPIEFVVRGYLAGHAWRQYDLGHRLICGKEMPQGLIQNSKLPQPILTPATKAESGHDEDISREEILTREIMNADDFDYLESKALALFERGSQLAADQGLILVDTKYEFGRDREGTFRLIDEVHTPDSSRYFYADTYEHLLAHDSPQRQLSKEFVREWLMEQGFQGKDGQVLPDMPDIFRITVSKRYIELYEQVTGQSFEPDTHPNPMTRIEQHIRAYLGI